MIQTKGQEKHLKKRLGITTFRPFFDEISSKPLYWQCLFNMDPRDSHLVLESSGEVPMADWPTGDVLPH